MACIINQSCGDFQQGGCLYKPTSGVQWTPKHSWMSDRPQKQASAKADLSTFSSDVLVISLLMELSIDGENCSLTRCVYVAVFGKADHIICYEQYNIAYIISKQKL